MADSSQPIGQDEIEALLKGAASPGGNPPSPAPAAASSESSSIVGQNEIEELLKSQAGIASAGKPAAKAAAAAQTPQKEAGMAAGDLDYLFNQAEQALASINAPVSPATQPPVMPFKLHDFAGSPASTEVATLELIRDVELDLKIELGRTHMYLEDVLKLRKGSVVPLDKLAGDPVDIFVNGRLIARGEVLVLNDNFCVRVAELVASDNAA
jgi:flagellar motor switch protein FliN